MFSTERLFAVADAANVAYLVGKKKAQNTVALDRSCRAQRSPCDRTKGASEENPVKLGTWPLIEIGQSRSKGTCWQPWENFMRSGATTTSGVESGALLPPPGAEVSLRSCVYWNKTSLSSSILRCRISRKTSSEWLVSVGSTTFSSVLFLISRS